MSNFRHKNRRESFPDLYNFKHRDSNSEYNPEEVSESFHWFADYNDLDLDKTETEIVKKRRNFAITRSKSFAHPVDHERRPQRKSVPDGEKQIKKKKSSVFSSTEVDHHRHTSVETLIQVSSLSIDLILIILFQELRQVHRSEVAEDG